MAEEEHHRFLDEVEFEEDWEEWDPSKGSFLKHTIAGSMAGVVEHVGMFPVDTYKTFLQASAGDKDISFRALVKREGFLRLWRGAPPVLLGCIPSHAAYFSVYELAKESFGVNEPGHKPIGAAAAGAAATMLHDAVITPVDVIKQRLQLGFYRGVWDCIKSIVKFEGPHAFWRSYPTTVLMNIPYASAVVATNESVKEIVNPTGEHNTLAFFFSGAMSGAVASAVTTPLDVVKTRLQTQQCGGVVSCARPTNAKTTPGQSSGSVRTPPMQVAKYYTVPDARCPQYCGFWDTVRMIYKEDGMNGFIRGMRARMMVHTPSMGLSWGTYEVCKYFLSKWL